MSALPAEPQRSRRNHWNNHVRRHAQMTPDAEALRFVGQATTWADLDRRTHAFAAALRRRGVQFGDRVLMVMLNRTEYVEAVLGANLIGAIAVPVNIRMSPTEIAFLITDSGAKAIVTETMLAPLASGAAQAAGGVDLTIVVGDMAGDGSERYADLVAEDASDLPEIDIPEDTTAMIMYTSGTTGRPRAPCSPTPTCRPTWIGAASNGHRRADGRSRRPMFHIAALGHPAHRRCPRHATVIHPVGAFDPDANCSTFSSRRRSPRCSWCLRSGRPCAQQQAQAATLA
jgi:fatty-acyl-CoA synthase